MALVPEYTFGTRAPGDARYGSPSPTYDRALAVFGQLAGEWSAEAKQRNEMIRGVKMAVDANERAVNFSLDMQGVIQRTNELKVSEDGQQRLADSEDQEAYFREQSQLLIEHYGNMPKADEEVQGRLQSSLMGEMASGLAKLRTAQHQRSVKEIVETAAATKRKAIESGNRLQYEAANENLVLADAMTDAKRDEEDGRFDEYTAQVEVQRLAFDSPETVLSWKTPSDMQAAFPGAQAEDFPAYRRLANGQKNYLEAERTKAQVAGTQALWDMSLKEGTTYDDIVKTIDALPGELFTVEEKDKWLRNTISRYQLINKGAADPLKIRQDYPKFKELLYAAEDGELTEKMARDAVNSNQIAIVDYQYLKKYLTGERGAMNSVASLSKNLKTMDTMIDTFADNYDIAPSDSEIYKLRGQRLLEDRMKQADEQGQPLRGRELEDEMLRVAYQIRDEDFTEPMEYLGVPSARFPMYEPPFEIGILSPDGKLVMSEDDKRRVAQWAKDNGWSLDELKSYLRTRGAKF